MASNGISYHQNSASAYVLPNDATEHERLEAQSRGLVAAMKDQPFQAAALASPIHKAVEVGSGTGHLASRLAREHPSAKIYGVDLSPVPSIHPKPDNLEYVVADIKKLIDSSHPGFEKGSFDYLFARLLICGVTDWPSHLQTVMSLLKPGTGWAEMHEAEIVWRNIDGEPICDDWNWYKALIKNTRASGLDPMAGSALAQRMKDAGFVDVQTKTYMWKYTNEPWDEHPELAQIGEYSQTTMRQTFARTVAKVSPESGDQSHMEEMDRSWELMGKGGHLRYFVVCGRRP